VRFSFAEERIAVTVLNGATREFSWKQGVLDIGGNQFARRPSDVAVIEMRLDVVRGARPIIGNDRESSPRREKEKSGEGGYEVNPRAENSLPPFDSLSRERRALRANARPRCAIGADSATGKTTRRDDAPRRCPRRCLQGA